MTIEDQNTDIVRAAFEAWNSCKGESVDCWMNIMAEEVNFRSLADGREDLAFTQERKSRDEVLSYLKGLSEMFEMINYKVDHYVAQGDRVVAVGSTSWKKRGTENKFDTPKVDVIRLKDGKIVEFFEYYDTAMVQAIAAS
ncbi:MAG: nuclear transport factor 2 family protein [Pseudomonadota bacterium]